MIPPPVTETPSSASSNPLPPDFVAVDWGTSSFRLWSLSASGQVLDRRNGPFGMSTLTREQYEGVLEEAISSLGIPAEVPAVVCGMAGAKQGWYEAPYVEAPTSLTRIGEHAVRVTGVTREVIIVPGIMQRDPANVMRGEETQILGLLQRLPDFDGVVALPGTHCKWVRVKAGRIEEFATCMTGELFALISNASVLKHSMSGDGWDDAAFASALLRAMEQPARVATELFNLRAEMLLRDLPPNVARARLSGMLVGLELAATRFIWQGMPVALIGAEPLARSYADALALNSTKADVLDTETMTLEGLVHVARQRQEITS